MDGLHAHAVPPPHTPIAPDEGRPVRLYTPQRNGNLQRIGAIDEYVRFINIPA